ALIHHVDSHDAFVPALRDVAPDVILSDHRPPRFDALAAIQACRDLQPAAPVIVLASMPDQGTRAAWLAAGASDIIPMDDWPRFRHKNGTWRSIELVTVNQLDDPSVSAVVSDCREIARYRLPEAARPEATTVPPDVLSPRQRQVLRLLAEGQSTRKIAEQLSL